MDHMAVTFYVHHCDTENNNLVAFIYFPSDNKRSKISNTQLWKYKQLTQYSNEDEVSYKKFLQQKNTVHLFLIDITGKITYTK